ncbi:MAG: site-2 protease family protein [Candidatus Omnitrophota bacterium]|jgi:Zn-dependent protease
MTNALISIAVFVIVIVAHELAHGYVAYRLGDPTARDAGRLTLNPLAHADPIGTVLLPALLIISKSPVVFGWAKPVPVNPNNFKDPRKGMLLTSIAGPGANIVLAVMFAAVFKTGLFPPQSLPGMFLLYGVIISLVLGIFNLMPIPPLDGGGIVSALLPIKAARHFAQLERYGFIILIGLLYLGLFDRVILPLVGFLTKMLLGG